MLVMYITNHVLFVGSVSFFKGLSENGLPVIFGISQPPAFLTLLCVSLSDSGSHGSVAPSCSSSWPIGRSLFQKPSLVLLFLYFISCLKQTKKYVQICCLSVFKIGGGRLGDCLCVVALVYSS